MTKEEILAMESGEELDRLVATEVMGEPMPEVTSSNALGLQLAGSPVKSPKGNWLCLCRYEEGDIPTWRPLPYSTDISAAWQVVDKISRSLFSIRLRFLVYLQEQTRHEIAGTRELVTVAWPDVFWWVKPDTICKSALLVKYSDKNN